MTRIPKTLLPPMRAVLPPLHAQDSMACAVPSPLDDRLRDILALEQMYGYYWPD